MIGDPSGKSKERVLIDEDKLRHNQECLRKQLAKFLDFDSDAPNAAVLVNNYDWMKEFTFLDFIRNVGKLITVNYMMSKDSVKRRLSGENGADGMSFTEFTYQLLQGYDFLYLNEHHNCKLQLGGADQWGNITTGTELIRKVTGNEAYAKMYGNNDFSFVAGRTKIVCLNTNAIEYDYSEPIPDFDFMEREAIADTTVFDRTIVCMHAAPFSEQFNNNVVKPFNYYITQFPGLLFCMYGHGHHTEEHDFFGNGVIYYEVASASKREYRIFVITPKGYSNEVVRL
mgnify:CR=1 FL=1